MNPASESSTTVQGMASKAPLLLDISRIIWRARRRSPTGIDRVELAYAQYFLAGEGPVGDDQIAHGERPAYGVVHLFGFLFEISPAGARRFVEALTARWQGATTPPRRHNLLQLIKLYAHLFRSAWLIGPSLRRKLRVHSGSPVFLVVSHHHVSRGHTIDRIRCNLGVKTACFLHDLIPIEHPEYFLPGWERKYHRLAGNVGNRFDAVIANSETTARSLQACLPAKTTPSVKIRVAAPGVRVFAPPRTGNTASQQDQPYFVVLGTIEPRKNHLLLLNLWTRLASTMPAPPRLLVIGARGWENEQVVDMLERSRRLRGLVEEHNGLSDSEVGNLLHGSRALLLPSFAEGFGLPVAEALGSGVPVICSDIPAFREVGRDVAEYLDPLDLRAWSDAVLNYSSPDSSRRAAQLQRLADWRVPRWADHFSAVEQLLGELDVRALPPLSAVPAASVSGGGSQALELS